MTDLQTCPRCGGRMKFGHIKKHATFTEKRRDCRKCPYGDKVHVRIEIREELLAIIAVARRAKATKKKQFRTRNLKTTQAKKLRNNRK